PHLRTDVHALNPPEPAVAPVAPLVGDAHLTENLAFFLGEEVASLVRVGQLRHDARGQQRQVEDLALAFQSEQAVELDYAGRIVRRGGTYGWRHGCPALLKSVSFHHSPRGERNGSMDLAKYIRDIPDFPKPGILFKDITPLLAEPPAFQEAIDRMCAHYK